MTNNIQRTNSEELDKILGQQFKVLDKGFIRVVDYMGNDSSVVQAARVSYGEGTKKVNEDKALVDYLMRHQHSTPFEMCTIKFHVKLPIFVARQWQRHRAGSYNEISARYTEVKDEFYEPEPNNINPQSTKNHQGRDEKTLFIQDVEDKIIDRIKDTKDLAVRNYLELLKENVARELARTILPVSQYTEFYWTVNLRNLFHFLKLRTDSHAQYEIRVYADKICDLVKLWVPNSYEAFEKYSRRAITLSAHAISLLQFFFEHKVILNQEDSGMSKREYQELLESGIFSVRDSEGFIIPESRPKPNLEDVGGIQCKGIKK